RAGAGTDDGLVVAPCTFGVFQGCNGNSVDDATDIATGTSEDCNGNGIPDECNNLEADNDGDGIIDACDDTPFGEVDGGGDGGDGSGDGGGGDAGDLGGFAVPCAFGMVAGLPAILLGLTWMKITSRRRRQKPC
ncbi:MAG: hypothetical protein IIB57_07330, partial [Planctomycetes bacterium]|nr:hypothetical protein [Planctomycetota bacterium]